MLELFKQRSVLAMAVSVAALVTINTPLPDITSQPDIVDGVLYIVSGVSSVVAGFAKPPAPAE